MALLSISAKLETKYCSWFPSSIEAHRRRNQDMRPAQFPWSIATISVKRAMRVKGRFWPMSVKPYAVLLKNDSTKLDAELTSRSTLGHEKPQTLCLASISTSSNKMITSKGMPPLLTQPYIGSSLLWIGIGVGMSLIFQLSNALLRVLKRMSNQAASESVQSNGSAFAPSAELTYPAESTSFLTAVQLSVESFGNADAQNFEVDATLMSEGSNGIEMQKPQKKHGPSSVYTNELLQADGTYRNEPTEDQQTISEQPELPKVDSWTSFLNSKPWTVPWMAETIIQVMLLWIASFWFVGSWIIPFLAHAAGFSKESLTHRGQALYSLLTDVAEGLAGIAILHRCLAKFHPLPAGWFHFSMEGNWHLDVGLGCLLFPLVNFLSRININLVPTLPAPAVGVSSVEQSIVARDPVAMALYALVVSVCAPIWEEILFRGFLLPSLTRYMPLWCSIVVTAVVFALAHFNAQRLLPLVFLGVVMGAVFSKSKNLMASMVLHSLWNSFVFLDLMK